MKKSFKSLLVLAGAALATSVAQANTYPLTETTTATAIGASTPTISVQTTVSIDGSDYLYTYVVTPTPLTGDLDSFSVEGGDFTGVLSITGTGGFSGINDGNEIDWTHVGKVPGAETFTYVSPLPPIQGIQFAQDTYHYNSSAVYVPGAPDGGLTMGLMGGALLGLGALRRKLGC